MNSKDFLTSQEKTERITPDGDWEEKKEKKKTAEDYED